MLGLFDAAIHSRGVFDPAAHARGVFDADLLRPDTTPAPPTFQAAWAGGTVMTGMTVSAGV